MHTFTPRRSIAALSIAAVAVVAVPLIALPAPAYASAGSGCTSTVVPLTITKLSADSGEPLAGATFAVTADFPAYAFDGDLYDQNPARPAQIAAADAAAEADAARTAASGALFAAQQAAIDAQNALAGAEASTPLPPVEELEELRAALEDAEAASAAALEAFQAAAAADYDAQRDSLLAQLTTYETADQTFSVTTDGEGTATVDVIAAAACNTLQNESLVGSISIPVIREVAAPEGYLLDETVHEAVLQDDGTYAVTVTNSPTPPPPPAPPTAVPLALTGSDLAAPVTFAAILAAAGGVLASGPLLRRLRR